jgi:hypothetical protein
MGAVRGGGGFAAVVVWWGKGGVERGEEWVFVYGKRRREQGS